MDEVVEQASVALGNALAEQGTARCTVVLQFSDETLRHAVATTEHMQSAMAKRLQERQHACELDLFVLADSNYGNVGADDISAMHVSSPDEGPTVLVRFGQVDLTTKGALPIMLVCPAKHIPSVATAADELAGRLAPLQNEAGSDGSKVWLVYEAAYASDCVSLTEQLSSRGIACECGRLPFTADLSRWSLNPEAAAAHDSDITLHRMAGLEFDAVPGETDVLVYVGTSESQLLSLNMQQPQHRLIHFDPDEDSWTTGTGATIRAYKQRAFAIQRAKDAEIVGLLLGSMGLETQLTQQVLNVLRRQCVAAGKKVYTFTMGKINEAKLSNFGEVDIYCLISNAESSVIDPRTFHVPLVTPVELQIALGVREWQANLETDLRAVVGAAGDIEELAAGEGPGDEVLEASEDNQVVKFESAAASRFAERSYQGLVPTVHKAITAGSLDDDEDDDEGGAMTVSYEIQQGQVGIASSYHAADQPESSSMR